MAGLSKLERGGQRKGRVVGNKGGNGDKVEKETDGRKGHAVITVKDKQTGTIKLKVRALKNSRVQWSREGVKGPCPKLKQTLSSSHPLTALSEKQNVERNPLPVILDAEIPEGGRAALTCNSATENENQGCQLQKTSHKNRRHFRAHSLACRQVSKA